MIIFCSCPTPDDHLCYSSCRKSANICNPRFNKLIGLADKYTFLSVSLSSALKYDCSGTAQARFWSYLHLCQCRVTSQMPKCEPKSCLPVAWTGVSLMPCMRKRCIQTVSYSELCMMNQNSWQTKYFHAHLNFVRPYLPLDQVNQSQIQTGWFQVRLSCTLAKRVKVA